MSDLGRRAAAGDGTDQPRREQGVLGPAVVRWNDYVGTAAADDADAIGKTRSLYDLAGLDRDRWTILAIELSVLEAEPRVTLYAVDRLSGDPGVRGDLDELSKTRGHIPVSAFHLTGPTQVDAFLNDAFKRVSIRLVARGVRDETLVVQDEQRVSGE